MSRCSDATALDEVMVGTVRAKWRVKYLGRVIEDCVVLTDVWVQGQGRMASTSPPLDAGARVMSEISKGG